jgi:hypothetical protein
MSGFPIDANVLSENYRAEGPDAGVKGWLDTTDRRLQYMSVITLAEVLEPWFARRVPPIDDSSIGATALAHDQTVVTRNTKDFEGICTPTINPWKTDDPHRPLIQ